MNATEANLGCESYTGARPHRAEDDEAAKTRKEERVTRRPSGANKLRFTPLAPSIHVTPEVLNEITGAAAKSVDGVDGLDGVIDDDEHEPHKDDMPLDACRWALAGKRHQGCLGDEARLHQKPVKAGMEAQLMETLVKDKIKEALSPDNIRESLQAAKADMDDTNAEAVDVWLEKGPDAMVEHVFTDKKGNQRSYAEMRMLHG